MTYTLDNIGAMLFMRVHRNEPIPLIIRLDVSNADASSEDDLIKYESLLFDVKFKCIGGDFTAPLSYFLDINRSSENIFEFYTARACGAVRFYGSEDELIALYDNTLYNEDEALFTKWLDDVRRKVRDRDGKN